MLGLYKFEYNVSRFGTLSGLFIVSKEDLDRANEIYPTIGFSECLGKHSEFDVDWFEHVTLVSEDEELIDKLLKTFQSTTLIGYDPFERALDQYQYSIEDEDD
jgi:hypothetical protein